MSGITTLRERMPPATSLPLPRGVDRTVLRLSEQGHARTLAAPPAGSDLKSVPGDFGLPLVGHTLQSMRFGTEYALRRYQRYGPVSWSGAFGTRIVSFGGPDATQAVLTNKDKVFSQQGWAELIDRFFHRGLMLLDFDEHLAHRRIMQEAFTRGRLAGYVDQFVPFLRDAVPAWPADGGSTRLYWHLKRLTLDVASRVFMGEDDAGGSAEAINRAFIGAVRAPTSIVRAPVPGGRWRNGLKGRRLLERYFAENLPAKRAGDGDDLFSALCHAQTRDGERFSDDDVVNHMIFLMMAAHDTATITSTAVAYYLAKYPQWQERAREESLAFGGAPLDIAGLESLHTLDLVIKEALRLVAPVPSMMRKTVADTEVTGHYIPAGTLCTVTPAINHYLPECWSDPHEFDPERFDAHRREDKSHRFAWIPFGGGAHKCIGMAFGTLEVKALLHEMLRNYRWSVPEGYQARWDYVSLPVPADGMPVQLTRL